MARKKMKPSITRDSIIRFRDAALSAEASGNHGVGHDHNVGSTEMRRGIWFWGSGRGWQLKKNWREVFAQRWPDIELPPKPELPKAPRPLARKELEKLLEECRACKYDYEDLEYWDQRDAGQGKKPGWRVWSESAYRSFFLGGNTHEAANTLRKLISKYREENGLSGQEPQLGGQAERTGLEPMMGGEG